MEFNWKQISSIIKYTLIKDFRRTRDNKKGKKSKNVLLYLFLGYIFSGYIGMTITQIVNDYFTVGVLLSSYFMILIGNFTIFELHNIIAQKEGIDLYSFVPVSSSSFFLSRIIIITVKSVIAAT